MSKVPFSPSTMVYPAPAVMVSCGAEESEFNIITIAWTGTVNSKPPMAYVSIRKERHSHDIIKRNGGFVINLTNEELAFATDFCGVKSGRDVNKFKHLNLTAKAATKVKAVMIEEAPVSIECEVKQIIELGSHDMFLAEVVAIHVDERLMDEGGKLCLERAKPIVYAHGEYYGIGEAMGRFGHSIMKKKTAQKLAKEKAVEDRKQQQSKQRAEKKVKKEKAKAAWEDNQAEWLKKQKKHDKPFGHKKPEGTYPKKNLRRDDKK